MDLRAMLNTDGGGAGHRSGVARPHPPPLTPSIPPPGPGSGPSAASGPGTPATPVQTAPPPLPPHSFRDYPHSAHTSPVSQPREYSSGHANHNNPPSAVLGQVPYASPTSYHPPPGQYSGRPSVPPLQPLAPHDSRSPSSASLSGPSPYRQTPTSSTSAGSAGYPFPLTQQPPASPGHHHQYGPSNYSRDAYSSQPGASSHGLAYSQGQQQQPQPPPQQQQLLLQQQSIPQTPPVGTPGGSQQYLQQRSLSIHSTTTPTSAHSKHSSYPPSFVQGSPIATHHPPAHLEQHHQHQSPQPAPLGLPMSASHRSPTTSYQQPPSPYQQRMPSGAIPYQPIMKASPPPPPPASIPRMPSSGHSAYDAASEAQRRSHSQQSRSERERSMSVSPKTRVPSLPSSTGQSSSVEQDPSFHPQPQRLQPLPPGSMTSMDSQRDVTPAKRKIDDRDLRPDEVENHRQPPPPPKMNGHHAALPQSSSTSPTMTPIRRIIHRSVPIWGQCGRKQKLTASRNFCIKQDKAGLPSSAASANGTQPEPGPAIKTESISRHPSPEDTRSTMPAKEESLKVAVKDPLTFGGQPFPWEPTIESSKPIDVISRSVADFFVFHVLQGPNPAELRARGAQVEIEAKLGTIIDKSTNDRIELRIQAGECVIGEGSRIAFRSSMTTNQHQVLNEYLNGQVKTSLSPRNFTATPRVPIKYVHRRQKDRFFELPAHLRQRLPAPIVNLLPPNAPLKARITYDQMTGNVVAKIVKARVADFHIHMAHMPLDCRISINIEWDWDGPPQEIEQNQVSNKDRQSDRNKDRLSYTHGFYQIDLTQVTQENQGPKGQPGLTTQEHELEIELDSRILYDQGQLLMKGEPNRYADLVDGLVDNVRVLARRCPPT
ncbi:CYTH-like domain-containing protein [Xylaria sp. CBS 124048]|nr:CYTH-like domain-containing protein [Xylaria sp. CBS 124048]